MSTTASVDPETAEPPVTVFVDVRNGERLHARSSVPRALLKVRARGKRTGPAWFTLEL